MNHAHVSGIGYDVSERDRCPRCRDIDEFEVDHLPALESEIRPLADELTEHFGALEFHTLDETCRLHIPHGYTESDLREMEYDVELRRRGREFVIDVECYETTISEISLDLDVGPVSE